MSEAALAVKPGYKTTEFWGVTIFNLISFAVASGVVPSTGWVAQVVAMVVSLLTTLGYGQIRTEVKNASEAFFADKPKWKSTEYILLWVSIVFGLVMASGAIPSTGMWTQVAGLVTSGISMLGYGQLRNSIKVAELPQSDPAAVSAT